MDSICIESDWGLSTEQLTANYMVLGLSKKQTPGQLGKSNAATINNFLQFKFNKPSGEPELTR